MHKRWVYGSYLASLGSLGVLLIAAAGSVTAERVGTRSLLVFDSSGRAVASGHPNGDFLQTIGAASATEQAPTEGFVLPTDPPDSPLASGSYVNFESPPVKALALSDGGTRLFAANTPNDTLVVYDTTQSPMAVVSEIPVGMDPVSVAVQPGTNSSLVWVANYISDNVSVVDISQGRIVKVIDVGDEPVNILFDADGSHAFVVVQGTPSVLDVTPGAPTGVVQEGALVVIDTSSRQIIRSLYLNMHTPRAAGTLDGGARIAVAALHSGNNTTVVGPPIRLTATNQQSGEPVAFNTNGLAIAQFFSVTAPIFADPLLSPYPDVSIEPDAPPVERIIPDAGRPSAWADIVAALSTPAGEPDPVMVAQLEAELEAVFNNPQLIFTNVQDAVRDIINDARDTDDNDLVIVNTADLIDPNVTIVPTAVTSNVGTLLTGMGVNPADDTMFISNLEALNLTRLEPNLRGHFFDHLITVVDSSGVVVAKTDLHAAIPNFNDTQAVNDAAQAGSLANPVDIVFRSDGVRAYVAALGTGRIGVLDGADAMVLGLADVGRGTRSLALDEANNRLYAFNRTDMSIAVVDVSSDSPTLIQTRPMFDPEPPVVRNGRDFLYSARLTNNFASSCAMCHVDGGLDDLSWDLGAPDDPLGPAPHIIGGLLNPCLDLGGVNHPLKGPMFTLSLQGLADHKPLHWRGDKPDFTFFNGAFDTLLGGSPLTPGQMQAYADFTDTIVYPPSPFHNRDNSFKDPSGPEGRDVFINSSCASCHQLSHDGAMTFDCISADAGFNLSGLNIFPQLQLTTQLRGIHKKLESDRFSGFGLVHDGRERRGDNASPLDTFLQNFFPAVINAGLDDELKAFVTAYPTNVMPVVGFQTIVESADNAGALLDVGLMIDQSALIPSRNDVVARGLVAGASRGYVLIDPAASLFQSDLDEIVTLDDLVAQLIGGDYLLFTSVPPGSGVRLGINQDLDCVSDGLDAFPQKNPDFNQDGSVDGGDLANLLAVWGDAGALGPADFDNLNGVTGFDLAQVLANWGACAP